jgi:CDGSH-type Zn-finger protein
MCQCKHTKNAPHCDGSHVELPVEDDGGSEEKYQAKSINTPEPYIDYIKALSRSAEELGHHGPM